MKKLLASTAVLVAFAGAASAQESVLERILGQINGTTNQTTLNGTFANIAENIGSVGSQTVYVNNAGVTISDSTYASLVATQQTSNQNSIVYVPGATPPSTATWTFPGGATRTTQADAIADANAAAVASLEAVYNPIDLGIAEGINGSINNVINGLDVATMTATVTGVSAVEYVLPTIDLGNISSTVLGAVNTGEITLGVNQSVDQAKTTATGALSSVIDQIGGSAATSALVLNIASNMTGVNGSINNAMTGVNGSVGDAATTVLGAVNTGTIVSGINAAVTGLVGGTAQSGL